MDKKAIEDLASYVVRAPLSLKRLVYLDGQKAVLRPDIDLVVTAERFFSGR